MFSRSAGPTDVLTPVADRRRRTPERAAKADDAAGDQESPLTRSALAFALRCHAGHRRDSDDAPFIEHPLECARLLRSAGCPDVLVAAGLLHHVAEKADVSATELTARFGKDVAQLVMAVTDDASVHSYRRRKQVLRERIRSAGPDAAALFAADRISRLRELPAQVTRDRARFDAAAPGSRVRGHLEYFQRIRLDHHELSLRMLQSVSPGHPLVVALADELARCPIETRPGEQQGRR
ncbi:MAG TPA: HD domain-containing protein [Solirubrobacteraceae bacterium]|jgi:hypothetical protein|nr:HD domain-containing protein [Solirubrobacteraceae bacterium]